MGTAKQIVFRYNGNPFTDEVVVDLRDEETVPERGAVIRRKEKQWKVEMVTKEETGTMPNAIPVYRVYLSDLF